MVQVSRETSAQTERRLLGVIAHSDLQIYGDSYVFEEFPLDAFPSAVRPDALAVVRDNHVWSQLVPSSDESKELFKVFSFHFDDCDDNSGFVGWLASHLKSKLGTGVFVTCGQNSQRGGIFDYWGCPLEMADEVIVEVKGLVEKGKRLSDV